MAEINIAVQPRKIGLTAKALSCILYLAKNPVDIFTKLPQPLYVDLSYVAAEEKGLLLNNNPSALLIKQYWYNFKDINQEHSTQLVELRQLDQLDPDNFLICIATLNDMLYLDDTYSGCDLLTPGQLLERYNIETKEESFQKIIEKWNELSLESVEQ